MKIQFEWQWKWSICTGSWYIFYVSVRFLSIRYYFHPNAHLVRFSLRLALLRLTAWISLVGVNDCSTLLSLQIEMESQKNTATNLERISGDYKQMKEENNALAKKLKAAKWAKRKLFYTNRYFLINNASGNKEFDWSKVFHLDRLFSLLFLMGSLLNPLLHGLMSRHIQNLQVRATRIALSRPQHSVANQLFTVVCLVTWPLNDREAGGDPVLIKTTVFVV